MLTLDDTHILTAYAERCSGPGWVNQLYWLVVRDPTGEIRQVAIQPEDWTKELDALFPWVSLAHSQVMGALTLLEAMDREKLRKLIGKE